MCMDKGYDYPEVYELLEDYGYTIHIRLIGEYRINCKRIPGYRARHWIVERTHSWMNRFDTMGKKVEKLCTIDAIDITTLTSKGLECYVITTL